MYVNILCMRQPLYVETWDKISKVHDCVNRAIGGLNILCLLLVGGVGFHTRYQGGIRVCLSLLAAGTEN